MDRWVVAHFLRTGSSDFGDQVQGREPWSLVVARLHCMHLGGTQEMFIRLLNGTQGEGA